MTEITNRPSPFSEMADEFLNAFSNVDIYLIVGGVKADAPIRAILRQVRDDEDHIEAGVVVEGVSHIVSISALAAGGLKNNRDAIELNGTTYKLKSKKDDGRAMVRLGLEGDL
ncbi:MAG: hypothetical protein ABJO86_00675 [Lentilitoribacter sp.]